MSSFVRSLGQDFWCWDDSDGLATDSSTIEQALLICTSHRTLFFPRAKRITWIIRQLKTAFLLVYLIPDDLVALDLDLCHLGVDRAVGAAIRRLRFSPNLRHFALRDVFPRLTDNQIPDTVSALRQTLPLLTELEAIAICHRLLSQELFEILSLLPALE